MSAISICGFLLSSYHDFDSFSVSVEVLHREVELTSAYLEEWQHLELLCVLELLLLDRPVVHPLNDKVLVFHRIVLSV